METNLKKLLPIVGVMLTSLTLAHAADDMMDNDYSSGANGATKVAPAVNQVNENAYGGFLWGEYLLWVPTVQSNFGTSGNYAAGSTTPVEGKAFYPDFDALSGFNVGLGMTMDHDNWDLYVDYTWLQKNSKHLHNRYTAASGVSSTAYGAFMPEGVFVDIASGYWTYQFNNIDLDCGRDFFVGHYFALRPHAGFKFAWTEQTLFAQYTRTSNSHVFDAKNHQHFWGVGIRGGVDPTFYFNDNWQLVCTTAVSFPWSKFKIDQTLIDTTPASDLTYYTFDHNFWMVAPVLEASMGIRWMTQFGDNNAYSFDIYVGWDNQVWFNQNNWINVNAGNSIVNGDLTQQGLTARLGFGF